LWKTRPDATFFQAAGHYQEVYEFAKGI